ncbi:SAM-dependent methyltransferase [Ornithinimicrobium cerasi]|uniref:SAM-dependent methyltransferase n=2 Tax=Ornithinimicrobium cerasi TaxID=2248773 RepID=UPI001483816A|nr:class I SAM-dependent methyltransferase [Ornithinimicrobium cerasi]
MIDDPRYPGRTPTSGSPSEAAADPPDRRARETTVGGAVKYRGSSIPGPLEGVDHVVVVVVAARQGDLTAVVSDLRGEPHAARSGDPRIDVVVAPNEGADPTAAVVRLVGPLAGPRTAILPVARADDRAGPDQETVLDAAAAAAWRTDARLLEHPIAWSTRPVEETSPFEDLHRREADPWDVHGSWFERRKRALTLAALPHERYAVGLEVGCSIGALTQELAARCDRLVAVDEAPAAVRAARLSTPPSAGRPTAPSAGRSTARAVEVVQARLPEEWGVVPAGLELVVLSEVGYFFSPGRLQTLARRVRASLEGQERAAVLACH